MTSLNGLVSANPFTETIDGSFFVGREDQLATFRANLTGLTEGRPIHGYVAGLHGTGKTFFLHKLAEIARTSAMIGATTVLDVNVTGYGQISGILTAAVKAVDGALRQKGVPDGSGLKADWNAGASSKLFQHPRQNNLLISDAVRQDFEAIAEHAQIAGCSGVVICVDEAQRIEPGALSVLKNALQPLGTYMVMLSLRISSDARGAAVEGRRLLEERAASAEGDIGAARLFVTGIPMGPFASETELHGFFRARTERSPIQFSQRLAHEIGEIAERVPRDLVRISSDIYTRALTHGRTEADKDLLDDAFPELQVTEMREALQLTADMAEDSKTILKALCAFTKPATGLEIVNQAYPGMPIAGRTLLAQGIERQLDDLCKVATLLVKSNEKFAIASGVYRFALKLAFGMT